MLKDPRVSFGVKLIKGPILSKARFQVESEDQEVHDYLVRQITRFWKYGAPVSLESLIYGFSGSEVIYKFDPKTNMYGFYNLKYLYPFDVKPLISKKTDDITHMSVSKIKGKGKVYVPKPKFFWTVHNRSVDRWFGQPRLEQAFIPWFEQWMPRGYRQIRQMWFYKNAFTSCVVKFPQGATKNEQGTEVPNVYLAQEMADRHVTGSAVCLPSSPEGDNQWDLEPGKGSPVPDGLLEYGEILGDAIWEGLGIPPEVVSADGTGAFAGRRVPQQAFYSVLQEIIDEHIMDANEQIFKPLCLLNFGHADYEINTISLLDTLQAEEMGMVTGKIEDRDTEHNRAEQAISSNQEDPDNQGPPPNPTT